MNESNYQSSDYPDYGARPATSDFAAELDECVRNNPAACIIAAVGIGVIAGILARGLRPEPTPQSRLAALLEELQERVHDAGAPALRKASALASESADILGEGVHRGEEHLEKILRKATRRLRSFLP